MSTTPYDYACTVKDVAALIRARTKDASGNELGIFTADTRPTDVQAQEAIDHAVILVHTAVGYIGDTCSDLATQAVAIGAAAEIELSYFPEQSRTDRSAYTFLIQRYTSVLLGLAECVAGSLPSAEGGPAGVGSMPYGTLDAISGVVHDYYTGRNWPPIPVIDVPIINPLGTEGGEE